jgi:uncharacterized membrane protein
MIYLLDEGGRSLIRTPGEVGVESNIVNAVLWLKLTVEMTGAFIIGLGVLTAIWKFALALMPPRVESYNEIRLTLARYLALALEFQLGADILSTAIAPSWDQIGKLGAIAVIRTALNYFLMREMSDERKGLPVEGAERDAQRQSPAGSTV